MVRIYFDAVQQMNKYNTEIWTLENYIHECLKLCKDDKEVLRTLVFICNNKDFKTILAIVFNYCPSKFHRDHNYELTSLYIHLLLKEEITIKEFNKLIGYEIY